MEPAGGLKLALEGEAYQDRRVRFASVVVAESGGGREIKLVTDSCGRLRYPLPAGQYHLYLAGDRRPTPFAVRGHGWTALRVRLL